jgi:hypothetical protein
MKRIGLVLLLLCGAAFGQQGNTLTITGTSAPSGTCSGLFRFVNTATGDEYTCKITAGVGAWHLVSGGGSSPLTTKGDLFGFSTVNDRVPVGVDGNCLKADSSNALGVSYSACAGAATGYQTIQNAAAAITQRTILNWTAGIVCSDNVVNTRSDCALANITAVSHQFFNAVTTGALVGAQPAFGDLSGSATTAQLPVVDVPHGGTALATLAIHQLYVGNGTSAPTAIAAGSNGQVLESAGGSADPAFQDPIVSGPDAVAATPTKNPVQVGCVFLTTPATLTNNQVGELQCDASQNLLAKVNAALPAGTNLLGKAGFDGTTPGNTNGITQFQPARTTGTITTSSTSIPVATTGYGVATVTVNGTYAGVTVNFEFSDDGGTIYYPTTCTRTDSATQEGTAIVLASNKSQAWDCGVFAATNFRVRSSAFTSGTANIGITLSAAPIEPAQTVSVSGTTPVSCASGATCPVNATLSAETTKVIGTVRAIGNAGANFDAATGAAVPANAVMGGLKDTAGNTQDALSDTNGRQFFKQYPDTTTTSYRASKKFAASSTTDNAVMPGMPPTPCW